MEEFLGIASKILCQASPALKKHSSAQDKTSPSTPSCQGNGSLSNAVNIKSNNMVYIKVMSKKVEVIEQQQLLLQQRSQQII